MYNILACVYAKNKHHYVDAQELLDTRNQQIMAEEARRLVYNRENYFHYDYFALCMKHTLFLKFRNMLYISTFCMSILEGGFFIRC